MAGAGTFGFLADYFIWWGIYLSLLLHTFCFFRFFPKRTFRKSALVLGNTLIFSCLLGLVAIAGETYIRFTVVDTDSFGMSLPARRWFALHTTLNSLGCRDDEWTAGDPPGIHRIAFVGDSFTYGWGIEDAADRFTGLLQRGFDERSPGAIEVLNVAKPGWATNQQLQPIIDMIELYGVDEVVLCYVPNDIEKRIPKHEGFDPTEPPQPTWFNLDTSSLADYLYWRVIVSFKPTVRHYHDWLAGGFGDDEVWRAHQQDLGAIIAACRDRQVPLRVVLIPFLRSGGQKLDTRRLHATLQRFFEANGVPTLDLAASVADLDAAEVVVSRFDAHPNERAHRLFAEAIRDAFYPRTSR